MDQTIETDAFLAARRAIMEVLSVTSAHASNVLRRLTGDHHEQIVAVPQGSGRLEGILAILRQAAAERSAEARAEFLKPVDAAPLPPPVTITGP